MGMGDEATGGGYRDFGPGGPRQRRCRGCVDRQAGQHFVHLVPAPGPRQGVEIMQIQEGLHMFPGAARYMVGQVLPALAHVDAAKFHAPKQRCGAGLILAVGFIQAPDMLIVDFAHPAGIAKIHVKQRRMPPVMPQHEGVATLPSIGMRLHPSHAIGDPALHFHHVGDGMMGPGIGAVDLHRPPPGRLCPCHVVGLLQAEGQAAI